VRKKASKQDMSPEGKEAREKIWKKRKKEVKEENLYYLDFGISMDLDSCC
jgi:hypothetical protein